MNRYAFFDVDNTIYNGYSTSGFYLFLVEKGICNKSILKKDKELGDLYFSGKIDYSEASLRVVSLQAEALKGLSVKQVQKLGLEFIGSGSKLYPFVKELFSLLESKGFQIYLISAAASPSIEAIGCFLGTDKFFASNLEIKSNKYTGEILQILNNEEKKNTLHKIMHDIPKDCFTLGFGDSTGDIDMLSIVNYAFVINPHQEEIKQIANEKHWILVSNENIISKVKEVLI